MQDLLYCTHKEVRIAFQHNQVSPSSYCDTVVTTSSPVPFQLTLLRPPVTRFGALHAFGERHTEAVRPTDNALAVERERERERAAPYRYRCLQRFFIEVGRNHQG